MSRWDHGKVLRIRTMTDGITSGTRPPCRKRHSCLPDLNKRTELPGSAVEAEDREGQGRSSDATFDVLTAPHLLWVTDWPAQTRHDTSTEGAIWVQNLGNRDTRSRLLCVIWASRNERNNGGKALVKGDQLIPKGTLLSTNCLVC